MEDQQNKIIVSISCLTYNHESYIRQCLDGFLMQKCNFKYEILIHDDASTDDTQEIINEYAAKYPEIIKPYFQKENQYSKGVRGMNQKFNYPRAKGKYIALCEGDDYWTDPLKLQKQVDFLEISPEYSMVFSNAKIERDVNLPSKNLRDLILLENSREYNDIEILEEWTIPTASVLFRKELIENEFNDISNNKKFIYGDIVLFLFLASKGKLFGMKEFFVVYRKHTGGVTQIKNFHENNLKYYNHLLTIIETFGKHLLTQNIKNILSYKCLYAGLSFLKKGNILKGLNFIIMSLTYANKIPINYFKNYILRK